MLNYKFQGQKVEIIWSEYDEIILQKNSIIYVTKVSETLYKENVTGKNHLFCKNQIIFLN
jgi:hypothetical protein